MKSVSLLLLLMLVALATASRGQAAAPAEHRSEGPSVGSSSEEAPWLAPDRSWSSWWRRRPWPWPRRAETLQRVHITPLLPSGRRTSTAELSLPASQIAAEGLRPEPAQEHGPRHQTGGGSDSSGSGSGGWFSYNSSEATPLVPSSLAWMTDADEMHLRAGGGGLDIDVARALSRLVAASYCNESNLPPWNCTRCEGGFRMKRTVFDPAWDLLGFVGYSQELNAIVVAFRGTDSHSLYNWVENMRTWRTDLALGYPGIPRHALVHGGFFYSYNSSFLAANISQAVAELVAEHEAEHRGGGGGAGGSWLARSGGRGGGGGPRESYGSGGAGAGSSAWRRKMSGSDGGDVVAPTVFVTGHSLGGALATLCALDLRLDLGLEDVRVVTFGSPRVGNFVFAKWFQEAVGPHWRFTHNRDIVPSVPPGYMGFYHVAEEVWVVDVLRGRTLVGVCDESGEDPQCHNSVCHLGLCTSLADHLLYLSEMYSPHPEGC